MPGAGRASRSELPLALAISDALLVRCGAQRRWRLRSAPSARSWPAAGRRTSGGRAPSEMVRVEGPSPRPPPPRPRPGPRRRGPPAPSRPCPCWSCARADGRSRSPSTPSSARKRSSIKPLGGLLADLPPFGGATITGEGRVILVVDPARLLALAESARHARRAAPRMAAQPGVARREPGVAARRVLLVDDSVSVRRFVGHMLQKAGFEVLTANDGAEALERLATTTVDVVDHRPRDAARQRIRAHRGPPGAGRRRGTCPSSS